MSDAASSPVTFDYGLWGTTYPELAQWVGAPQAQVYFDQAAELYLGSAACGSVRSARQRLFLLNMLTAHLVKLFVATDNSPAPDQVGRISSASEGGVSVSFDMGPQSKDAAWYLQTKYGAAYWQATAPYRTARYYRAPQPYLGVTRPYGGYRGF
jgi:hypothetical protein